jgi:hypothetical protein
MRRDLLHIFLLSSVLLCSYSHAAERFSWLEDIKGVESSWNSPVVVAKHDGGYIVFWAQREERPEELSFPPEYYYYRIIDVNGKIVVERKELKFWRVAPHPTYFHVSFNSNSMLWLDTSQLLIIAWKAFDPHHVYKLERIIMNSNGDIVAGPDTLGISEGIGPNALLVKNNKGKVYAVDYVYGLEIMQVYPEFGKVEYIPMHKLREFYKEYPAHTFGFIDPVITITTDDELLICSHAGWGYIPLEERGMWDTYRPHEVFYVHADLKGNYISDPVLLNVTENAFRMIPGTHLGGMYYTLDYSLSLEDVKLVGRDMDLTTLPSDTIILSITAPDENGKLAVYQLKFNPQGNIVKPAQTRSVNTRSLPLDRSLPTIKCLSAQIWSGVKNRRLRTDLVLFGFDEEGNFYSDRILWREN